MIAFNAPMSRVQLAALETAEEALLNTVIVLQQNAKQNPVITALANELSAQAASVSYILEDGNA